MENLRISSTQKESLATDSYLSTLYNSYFFTCRLIWSRYVRVPWPSWRQRHQLVAAGTRSRA